MRKPTRQADERSREIRCAIYTRKSEEGLEQEFNSLEAQREACAAYITSQRHEGWTLIPTAYDDGGFSGGTLERPALRRLLDDVAAGRVDVILVYKIDRLSRSLADFSRIVETLEEASASFVSITQAFNTSTSMGRLTLNVLLSFAQFEREVTGERIRDKVAQSKARGMWMGGVVPLGYRVETRKLIVDDPEAETVRFIMRRYLQLGSVQALHEDLKRKGITGRARRVRGELTPAKPMSRGALYLLLSNRMYLGEICHKGRSYPGEHDGIVSDALFLEVQRLLDTNRNNQRGMVGVEHTSLLAGMLWDAHGRRMSPSHAVKNRVKRYRYYVSRDEGGAKDKPIWRVPAGDLEALVIGRLKAMLLDEGQLLDAVSTAALDAASVDTLLFEARRLSERLGMLLAGELRASVLQLVSRAEVHEDHIQIVVRSSALKGLAVKMKGCGNEIGANLLLSVPARLARIGREIRLLVPPSHAANPGRRDPGLIKLIVKAQAARAAVDASTGMSFEEIAMAEGYDRDYFGVLVRLGYLAPDTVSAIVDGRQPLSLNRQTLARISGLPFEWERQRQVLGF